MAVSSYQDLAQHIGHQVAVVAYGTHKHGRADNIAIECGTCSMVLLDFDRPQIHGNVLHHDHGALTGPHRHDLVSGAWISAVSGVWISAASEGYRDVDTTDSKGYRLVEATLEIMQSLTEAQFRRLEELLGRQPERFKGWADHFWFALPLDADPKGHPAVVYAAEQHLSLQLELVLAQP